MWFEGGRYALFDSSFGIATRQSVEISGPTASILVDDFVVPFVCSPHDFGPTPNYTTNLGFQYITYPGKVEKIVVPCDKTQEQQMVDDMATLVLEKRVDEFWPEVAWKTQFVLDCLIRAARERREVEVEVSKH